MSAPSLLSSVVTWRRPFHTTAIHTVSNLLCLRSDSVIVRHVNHFVTYLLIDVTRNQIICLLFQLSAVVLPGNHVVKVMVTNGLGNVSAVVNVSVLYPLTIHRIIVNPVTLGRPFVIEVTVTGDLDFTATVDYGDGNIVNSSTATLNADILPVNDSFHTGPVYLLKFRHIYTTAGSYVVLLSVSNRVSHVTKSLMAHVADADFSVTLSSECKSPTASNTFMSLTAAVTVGHDVGFNWICDYCTERPVVHR